MAVSVASRGGRLEYRLYFQGDKWREGTGLRDTPGNRTKLDRKAATMSDLMADGRFDYLQWFPDGNRASKYRPVVAAPIEAQTVREYAEGTWQPQNQPPLVRASLAMTRAKHLRCHILPAFGDRRLDAITPAELDDFRAMLTRSVREGGKGLKLKSAKDIVGSTFRALYRDARTKHYARAFGAATAVAFDPFAVLEWKRETPPKADPFAQDERDLLAAHFLDRRRPYHGLVYVLFHTGLRTGEAVGLRWGDVDLRRGELSVQRSRSYGEDNAPKTKGSARTIKLAPDVVAVLRALRPLHVAEDAFVFVTPAGAPIDGDRFVENQWRPALRATGIRPRKLYATRSTFLSLALTRGANLTWLAKYAGTSVAMIEAHYGKYMQDDDAQLALLSGSTSPLAAATA